MIFVDRSAVPRPEFLDSPEVQGALQAAQSFFSIPEQERRQRRFDYPERLLASREIRDRLLKLFHDKCAFCEMPMSEAGGLETGRYRPLRQAIDLEGRVFPDHYWWLMFDWSNLYAICPSCSRACGTRFPILGERAEPGASGEDLLREQPQLLDPCYDRPEDHLVYSIDGHVVSSTRQGQITIEVYNLNRRGLIAERRKVFHRCDGVRRQLLALMEQGARPEEGESAQLLQTLRRAGDPDQPYAGMMRQFLKEWLPSFASFAEQSASLEEVRESGDRAAEARALLKLAQSAAASLDFSLAQARFREALAIAQMEGDAETALYAQLGLGGALGQLMLYDEALQHLEDALADARELGYQNLAAMASVNLGVIRFSAGDLAGAVVNFNHALAAARRLGDRTSELSALLGLGNSALGQSNYAEAAEYYNLTLTLARETGSVQAEQAALNGLGSAYSALGRPDEAREYYLQQQSLSAARTAADIPTTSAAEPPAAGAEPPQMAAEEAPDGEPSAPPAGEPPVGEEQAGFAATKLYEQNAVQQFGAWKGSLEMYNLTGDVRRESYFASARMVDRVEISNFKVIKYLDLDVTDPTTGSAPWLMLLGENGSGKSSVLQAVTLALVGDTYRSELPVKPQDVLRYGEEAGYVKVYLSNVEQPVVLTFNRDSDQFHSEPAEPKILVLAYGSTRLLPRGRAVPVPGKPYAHVDNMFDPFVPLRDATAWLLNLDETLFNRVARSLKDLLALEDEVTLVRRGGAESGVFVIRGGVELPLTHLSDGYQSVLAFSADVLAIMLELWEAPEVAEGLVMVDELGAHLHPRWRMRIVKSLRQAFPRIQFLASTHDPLCLRGLNQGEVVVMRLTPEFTAGAVTDLPPVQGLRVDQLLTSEHFGMSSTIDPDVEALFQEYYELLAARQRTAAQEQRLDLLKEELQQYNLMGSNRRERMLLEIIDEYLAEEPLIPDLAQRKERESQARREAKAVWASLK